MKLKLLACKVMQREISYLYTKCENFIDITYIRQGFHDEPAVLKKVLQDEINAIENQTDVHSKLEDFDAILIGYGLCSNGISGLSSTKYPLVIPKAHDCITLLLGSREMYNKYFTSNRGGIYWYSTGWIENSYLPSKQRDDELYANYLEKYGEDNAKYLIEFEHGWQKDYSHAIHINWDEIPFNDHINFTKEAAKYMGWEFELVNGKSTLLENLLSGNWNNEDFLIVPPGKTLEHCANEDIIRIVDKQSS